jgi:glutamine phosphoribosylpyrophosphate amidotransferase
MFLQGRTGLGHTRLSIIDVGTGAQPMLSAAGQHVIVYNGELYNYKIIREDLLRKGYVFKTYEGQLHLGGSVMMTEQSIWNFSATNDAVYQTLQKSEGKTVTLHYRQMQNAFPWQGDTDYIVYKVETQ